MQLNIDLLDFMCIPAALHLSTETGSLHGRSFAIFVAFAKLAVGIRPSVTERMALFFKGLINKTKDSIMALCCCWTEFSESRVCFLKG